MCFFQKTLALSPFDKQNVNSTVITFIWFFIQYGSCINAPSTIMLHLQPKLLWHAVDWLANWGQRCAFVFCQFSSLASGLPLEHSVIVIEYNVFYYFFIPFRAKLDSLSGALRPFSAFLSGTGAKLKHVELLYFLPVFAGLFTARWIEQSFFY